MVSKKEREVHSYILDAFLNEKSRMSYTLDALQNGEKMLSVLYLMPSKMEKKYFGATHPRFCQKRALFSSSSYSNN